MTYFLNYRCRNWKLSNICLYMYVIYQSLVTVYCKNVANVEESTNQLYLRRICFKHIKISDNVNMTSDVLCTLLKNYFYNEVNPSLRFLPSYWLLLKQKLIDS